MRQHAPDDMTAFADKYLSAECGELICIDEAGFHAGDCCRRGYSPRGQRLNVPRGRTLRCVKYTVVMAVSNQRGVVGVKVLDHNCRKADFLDFLTSLQINKSAPAPTLLMDNIAFHHSKETRELITTMGCEALYIPPYSPRFNAIEMVFAAMKHVYRRKCPSAPNSQFDYRRLVESVANGVGLTEGYFAHVRKAVQLILTMGGHGISGYDS